MHRCPKAELVGIARAHTTSQRPGVATPGGLGCKRLHRRARAGRGGSDGGPAPHRRPPQRPGALERRATEARGRPQATPAADAPLPETSSGRTTLLRSCGTSAGVPCGCAHDELPQPRTRGGEVRGPIGSTPAGAVEPPAGWVGGKHRTNEPWPKWPRPGSLCVNSGFTTLNLHIIKLPSGQIVK